MAHFLFPCPCLSVLVVFRYLLYRCLSCVACWEGCFSCPTRICLFVYFSFVCLLFLGFLFWVPSWRRCPLQATFTSVSFCLLSLFDCLFSDRVRSHFVLVWLRLACDHGWIRRGSINVRWTTTATCAILFCFTFFAVVFLFFFPVI